jgi:hypothetical protein
VNGVLLTFYFCLCVIQADAALRDLEQLTMGVFVIGKEGERLLHPPEDIGIVIEGVEVVNEFRRIRLCHTFGLQLGLSKATPFHF